jgi:DNA modification methylase
MRGGRPERAHEPESRISYSCKHCGERTDAFSGTDRLSKQVCRRCYGKRKDLRPRELNDLDGKTWAAYSRSVEKFPDIRSEKQRLHGAAFPIALARQHIEMYSGTGDLVLDPFVGVGTTLDAARRLGRRAVGLDINKEFIAWAEKDLQGTPGLRAIGDDARNMRNYIDDSSVDLLLTSPPYSNLLKTVKGSFAYKWKEHSTLASIRNPQRYSTHVGDLGNLGYDDYLDEVCSVMMLTRYVLKTRAYAVWIVKDYRDIKHRVPYVNFHGDIIQCAEVAGFQLWDIRIFDQTQFRPLVCLGFPSKNFYLNIGHSYILVFRNP